MAASARFRFLSWRSAAVYAACWVPLAVVYIALLTATSGGTLPVHTVVSTALLNTLGPALLGVVIVWMTGRVPFPKRLSAEFVAVHLSLAGAFVAAWLWWAFIVVRPLAAASAVDPAIFPYVLPWQAIIGLMLYVVVAGVSYAVRGAFLVNSLAVAAATADRLRAEAELAALRAHLDPHFLFGTLHGVMQLLRDDPAHAERALERLAELLRYVLRLDRAHVRLVTLETEWQFVQSYLWLEQLRLGDRLRVDAQLEDDALACMVPPFTLQPLVENAIRHGLSPKPQGGRLRITARTTEDQLELEIADDGLGRATPPDASVPGLGIQSVVRRLRAHFGDARVGAEIATALGAGFSVRLVVPAQPTDDAAEAR